MNNFQRQDIIFLRGFDYKMLEKSQQQDFLNYVKLKPFGHSFMIYNSNDLKNKIHKWKQTLLQITPFFAVKSNPIIEPIIQDIIDGPYGTFDCASKREITMVMKYGVPGSKVVYSNPVKEEKTYIMLTNMVQKQQLLKILLRISIVEVNLEMIYPKYLICS